MDFRGPWDRNEPIDPEMCFSQFNNVRLGVCDTKTTELFFYEKGLCELKRQ